MALNKLKAIGMVVCVAIRKVEDFTKNREIFSYT